MESYTHRFAKKVLAKWFRKLGTLSESQCGQFLCFPHRDKYPYGVMLEYPIMGDGLGITPPWDLYPERRNKKVPPTRSWCIRHLKRKPVIIADVVVFDHGRPRLFFEVVHRHPTPERKKAFYRHLKRKYRTLEAYEISATWILNQIDKPRRLPVTKLV